MVKNEKQILQNGRIFAIVLLLTHNKSWVLMPTKKFLGCLQQKLNPSYSSQYEWVSDLTLTFSFTTRNKLLFASNEGKI